MNLLHKSDYFASYQCDSKRCFYLDFGEKTVKFSFCQLLALRQKIQAINLDTHFDNNKNAHGIEILSLCNREHILILDTLEVIDLKNLVRTTFGMLEINAVAKLRV